MSEDTRNWKCDECERRFAEYHNGCPNCEVGHIREMTITDYESLPVGVSPQYIERLRADRDRLAAELAEAREVIDKLPKTADGVPITPMMEVWHFTETDDEPVHCDVAAVPPSSCEVELFIHDRDLRDGTFTGSKTEIYSTRAAALAAKEQK